MWVKMIVGFDRDGLLIPKWRDAFLAHGAQLAELTVEDEDVELLRRRAVVARLTIQGKEVTPPLVDAVMRYAKERALTISGFTQDEPFNRWRAQAWRMEIVSIHRPPAEESP